MWPARTRVAIYISAVLLALASAATLLFGVLQVRTSDVQHLKAPSPPGPLGADGPPQSLAY